LQPSQEALELADHVFPIAIEAIKTNKWLAEADPGDGLRGQLGRGLICSIPL
jgi:hypothetical protein